MAQDVITRYRLDVDDMLRQLQIAVERIDKLEIESKAAAKGLDQVTKAADKLDKELASTGKSTKQATDNVKGFAKTAKSEFSGVGSAIKTIGDGLAASLGVVFSADAALNFSKASVNAFLAADKTANKLKNTILAVNGETEEAFDRLIQQSKELQDITVFSDDSIQQAQTALAAFGLTSDQITELLPKLADFAAVSNTDIVQAAEKVGAGLEGAGREFKKYGIQVSATASRFDNFNTILKGFTRFQGAASAAADTFAGRLEQQTNRIDDLQEQIGQKLLPAFLKIKEFGLRAVEVIADLFGVEQQKASEKAAETYGKIAGEFNLSIEVLKRGNLTQEQHKDLIAEINTQYSEYLPNLLTEKSSLQEIEKAQAAVNKQLEGRILLVALEEDIVRITKNAAVAARDLIQVQRERIKAESDLTDNATASETARERLNQREALANALVEEGRNEISQLQAEYAKLAAQLGINTSAQDKLLAAQKGLNEESDKRIAGSEKEIELLKTLDGAYSAIFDLLDDQDTAKLIELSVTASIDSEQDIKEKIALLEKILQDNAIELPITVTDNVQEVTGKIKILEDLFRDKAVEIPILPDPAGNLEKANENLTALIETAKAASIALPVTVDPGNVIALAQERLKELIKLAESSKIDIEFTLDREGNITNTQKRFEELLKLAEDSNIELSVTVTDDTATIVEKIKALEADLEANAIEIPITPDVASFAAFREAVAKLAIENKKKLDDSVVVKPRVDDTEFNDGIDDITESALSRFLRLNQDIIQASQDLVNSLQTLYNQSAEAKINAINEETEAQLTALDRQEQAIESNLDKRRISERQAEADRDKLAKQRVETEKKAADQIRAIKRKQFILDKAAALIEITISTAKNVAAATTPQGKALQLASGLAQAAIVAAQPVPYKKGSKDTGKKEHLALVGEEGPELMMMSPHAKILPAKETKSFGEVIEAMRTNRFDTYVSEKYVTPELSKRSKEYKKEKDKDFAQNITESFVFNSQHGLTGNDLEQTRKRGQIVNNVQELAEATARELAKELRVSPYRR